jgi:outer membrane immunogenic protein
MSLPRLATAPLAAAVLLLLPTSVIAADLGAPYRPYSAQPNYSGRRPLDGSWRTPLQQSAVWTGLYGGIHAGGAWGTAEGSGPLLSGDIDTSGTLLGVHAGYNMQYGQGVLGLEVDGTWTDADGSRTFGASRVTASHDWLSSIRGRAGYAVNDWLLVYATLGVGFGGFEVGVSEPGFAGSRSDTLIGYVAGGGVDLKLTDSLSARVEALHYGFGEERFSFPGGTIKGDADITTVRAGLSFHLN